MLTINYDTLEQMDATFIQLLVDAGWIEITREWWCEDRDGWIVRKREKRKLRKHEHNFWNFPSSEWSETRTAPEVGKKRGKVFVAHVANEFTNDHVVEFKILSKAVMS